MSATKFTLNPSFSSRPQFCQQAIPVHLLNWRSKTAHGPHSETASQISQTGKMIRDSGTSQHATSEGERSTPSHSVSLLQLNILIFFSTLAWPSQYNWHLCIILCTDLKRQGEKKTDPNTCSQNSASIMEFFEVPWSCMWIPWLMVNHQLPSVKYSDSPIDDSFSASKSANPTHE